MFSALLVPLMLFGLLPGVQTNNFINAFEKGFGSTLGSIGVVIVLGSIIAEALRHTGAIQTITRTMVKAVGSKRMPLALTLTGFVLGIAIFSDVAYVILNPLVHSAARMMNVTISVMSTGLVGALQLTHAIVPPTPGPLAAAAILGADIGTTIVFGAIACFTGSIAGWIWGQYVIGPRIKTMASDEYAGEDLLTGKEGERLPGTWASYAPILVPILLISAQSVSRLFLPEGHIVRSGLAYIGWPVAALSVGVWLSYRNISTPEHSKDARSKWIEDALRLSAMILIVTGLGGSLSEILKGTPAVDTISGFFADYGLPAILLPFVIGIIGNMITGSTTVGVITAASLVAPMLGNLALSPGSGDACRRVGVCHHQVRQQQLLLGLHVIEQTQTQRRNPGLRRRNLVRRHRLVHHCMDLVGGRYHLTRPVSPRTFHIPVSRVIASMRDGGVRGRFRGIIA